jgi:uncharacterized protein
MTRPAIPALILAAGLVLGGLLFGVGVAQVRAGDRFVTVKGVAEREVQADLAIWPLRLVAADNDLAQANRTLRQSEQQLRAFLAAQGIDSTQLSVQDFSATDAFTNQYGGNQITSRYVLRQTVVVRSANPAQILAASQRVAELVSAGVVLSSGSEYGGNNGPTFLFTKLNDVKGPMIAEATARARESAEQFARDSRASLGGIRRANQGVFEILPRDQAPGISEESQVRKTVRVVSTVEYLLK